MGPALPFPNAGFEDGLEGWTVEAARGGEVGVVAVEVPGSRLALRILATAERNGARVDGPRVPCAGRELVELYGSVCSRRGRSLGLWGYSIAADGTVLPGEFWTCLEACDGVWRRHGLLGVITPHPRAAFLQVTLIAYPRGDEVVECLVDDFALVLPELRIPPLPRRYKLAPADTALLSAADVPGPDGVVYPDWRRAGVQGGIPEVPVVLDLAEAGGAPGTDIAGLLGRCCAEVGARGGGAIRLGPGTYYLDQPVTLAHDGVVIRGAGRDLTRLVFRRSLVDPRAPPPERDLGAVFTFRGRRGEREYPLARDGRRGDTVLELRPGHDLAAGDKVILRAPDTRRWEREVNHRAVAPVDPTHAYHMWGRRTNQYEVLAVEGGLVRLGQALRIDYPAADGSHLLRTEPVQRCGIEDLAVEHACRQEYHTVTSLHAWNCWVRRVEGVDCGRSGVHFQAAKWCEVRDCVFTGFDPGVHVAHVNWGGYAGFTMCADCLMERTVWHRFRHGPVVQFGAQGNVIRDSAFLGSEAQWHAGWAAENLFENCVVRPDGAYGAYGWGAYATGSYDGGHGPNGPRNVVYNCDLAAARDGVMLNGVLEHLLLLHNRIVAEAGAGVVGLCGVFDLVVRHNTFVLRDAVSPLSRLLTSDCTGVELVDNVLVGGNGRFCEGAVRPGLERGNRALPSAAGTPGRPAADPPSIFDWQRRAGGRPAGKESDNVQAQEASREEA